jgi:hypothetical protein
MSVYVDNLMKPYKREKVCHMIADTEEELISMILNIGGKMENQLDAGTADSRFDVNEQQRELALENGAIEISKSQLAKICRERREAS